MANADIVLLGPGELPLITEMFNAVFRPGRDISYFERRLKGRANPLILLAQVEKRPAGFALGYEIKQSTFYAWLIGVLPAYRKAGIASQLMEAMTAWTRENGYHVLRFECYNRARPMLKIAASQNFDIVGVRYDTDEAANLVIFEQTVSEQEA
ncbi:MAG TPA: GNAT family N-acetyltransferase [Phycisphaerae bacterium]|nr:GNAT family N-acetyltransferase [Phycisphaerae bacterium]HOJ74762.1 GNAT family N-acetyltransferase [Phycisphaerae bacterium]HOM52131.1 GNAT family N-acetyltransferase [Phycisphaerae bacterium]HON65913.1 GNAT family N-acetyltransferase [Phycisphaerae bacterium]HOQ85899.1 GNAT family N-acetyltransferase [Phycisphaerae bacterium]